MEIRDSLGRPIEVVVVSDLAGMESAFNGSTVYVADSGSDAGNRQRAESALPGSAAGGAGAGSVGGAGSPGAGGPSVGG